ncbi:MAG: hypothetical protein LBO05_12390 [Deltaproteobacteria bacterium]|jgi:hypothetical protein|nr:hypothetical protein [Deltaproteobacteria bacterium]
MSEVSLEKPGDILRDLQIETLKSYFTKDESVSDREWLIAELKTLLPEAGQPRKDAICNTILDTLGGIEEKRISLQKFLDNGRSGRDWYAAELLKEARDLAAREQMQFLSELKFSMQNALVRHVNSLDSSLLDLGETLSTPQKTDLGRPEDWNESKFKAQAVEIAGLAGKLSPILAMRAESLQSDLKPAEELFESVAPEGEGAGEGSGLTFEKVRALKISAAAAILVAKEKGAVIAEEELADEDAVRAAALGVDQAVETAKVASGENTALEAIEKAADAILATLSDQTKKTIVKYAGKAGAVAGGFVGKLFGPAGATVGAKVGEVVFETAAKIILGAGSAVAKVASVAKDMVCGVGRGIASAAKSAWNFIFS